MELSLDYHRFCGGGSRELMLLPKYLLGEGDHELLASFSTVMLILLISCGFPCEGKHDMLASMDEEMLNC